MDNADRLSPCKIRLICMYNKAGQANATKRKYFLKNSKINT